MTCTTFLHDSELNVPLPDQRVQEILDEVRELSGQDLQVVPLPRPPARLFRPAPPQLYGVYVYVGGIGPWQQLNFWGPPGESSICLYQTMEVVAAFLMGLRAGLTKGERS